MNKKITPIKSLTFFIALFCAINFGFGQSIFNNAITYPNPSLANPFTTGQVLDPNISVLGIGRGTGINPKIGTNRYNARDWNLVSLDSNDYFEFTLTPNAGYKIDFVSFLYTGESSPQGPTSIEIRSSIDGYTSSIGTPTITGTTIDLSSSNYQNITSAISFRVYAWGGSHTNGTFSINDFTFNGSVNIIQCPTTVTWNGSWSGARDINTAVIIAANYDTATNGGSFSACSLTVNAGATLNIADNTFVEVQNDVTVDGGEISVSTQGALVQNDDLGTFSLINSGTSTLNKRTRDYYDADLHYTYWSSPVENANIVTVFPNPDDNRRYLFNASNFLDANGDTLDDDINDWQPTNGLMTPGYGYAVTSVAPPPVPSPFPYSDIATFSGVFNTGDVTVSVFRNDSVTTDENWNLIGNPYPSAISVEQFFLENAYLPIASGSYPINTNGRISGAIYLWSHISPSSAGNLGNEVFNYSQSDYAQLNLSGGIASASGSDFPNDYIPSGQGFFVSYENSGTTIAASGSISEGEVKFTNSMRMADGSSNSQFFKSSNSKNKKTSSYTNKLWVNLTSDNGVFNQILLSYINGATNADDGLTYDAIRLASSKSSILYSIIEDSNKKFAIQGKSPNSLNDDEIINLGFDTNFDVPTIYTLSLAQLQGDFLTDNPIYLKDNLLNKVHCLSTSDYTFTSDVGEFKDRFEIVFNGKALATDDFNLDDTTLMISQMDDTHIRFKASNNVTIKTVSIYDLLGRQLYELSGSNNEETYNLSNLNNFVFIAKVELSNGTILTKKAILK